MRFEGTLTLAVIVACSALPVASVAQPTNPDIVSSYILVKVLPGVEPALLDDGRLSFSYVAETTLPPSLVRQRYKTGMIADDSWGAGSVWSLRASRGESGSDRGRVLGWE